MGPFERGFVLRERMTKGITGPVVDELVGKQGVGSEVTDHVSGKQEPVLERLAARRGERTSEPMHFGDQALGLGRIYIRIFE